MSRERHIRRRVIVAVDKEFKNFAVVEDLGTEISVIKANSRLKQVYREERKKDEPRELALILL